MLVTLSSPPGAQLRGVVSGIEPGKSLTLRNGKQLLPHLPDSAKLLLSHLPSERKVCARVHNQRGGNRRAGRSRQRKCTRAQSAYRAACSSTQSEEIRGSCHLEYGKEADTGGTTSASYATAVERYLYGTDRFCKDCYGEGGQ